MKELNCEDVLMARMAAADSEEPRFSTEQLEAHVASCAGCQRELQQMQELDLMLAGYKLSEPRVDLWPAIENRIARRAVFNLHWRPFALIGVMLVIYKLLELLPERDPGLAFKLVPLVIVVLLFVLIKENPFRINTELVLER